MKNTFYILILLIPSLCSGQGKKAERIDSLLQHLLEEQTATPEFDEGIFHNYRLQEKGKTRYADDNIFFSSLIAVRLIRLEKKIPSRSRDKAHKIIENVRRASVRYENKYGRISYNFWQTKPVKQFPGDPKRSRKTHYHIPDDTDDSALLYLVNQKNREEVQALKKMMEENIPGKKRNIQNTLKQFKTLPAYSTWLGDRMPPEFDLCVLTNVLYLFHAYKIPYTQYDWASITYIREAFVDGYLQRKAYRISPQYRSESACLYQLAFLISAYEIAGLSELKPQLINRLYEKRANTTNKNETLLLVSALSYLGEKMPSESFYPAGDAPFPFFFANQASVIPNPFNDSFAKSKAWYFPYECKAWNSMLQLEILLLND